MNASLHDPGVGSRRSAPAAWLSVEWPFVASILAGGALRLYQLREQVIADDEWHALHAVRDLGFSSILQHFGGSDISIPMALFYKAVTKTVGLSEFEMRVPVVLFGLLGLVVLPLLVRNLLGRTTATLFAWLLAISPLPIYYSRYARPYAISLFCAFCAICAIYLWWKTRTNYWKYLYAVCAIVGPYFHLSVLPILFLPLVFLFLASYGKRPRNSECSRAELLRLMFLTGGVLAVLLLPPIWTDSAALAEKSQNGHFSRESIVGALGLLLGMQAPAAQVLSLAVMMIGTFTLSREQPRLALLLSTTVGAGICVIVAVRPAGVEYPIVVARYTLFLLPVMILVLAIGLHRIGGWLSAARYAPVLIWATWMILTVKLGPLGRIYYAPNNFTNHAVFQYYPYFDAQRNPYTAALSLPVPQFYFELSHLPPASLRIVEAPWNYEWGFNPYPFYQQVHRQRVAIGFVKSDPYPEGELPLFDRRFHFSNFAHVQDPKDICAHGIDRVVFHKDLQRELTRGAGRNFSEDLSKLIPQYRHDYGSPSFEDDVVVVFDTTAFCRGPLARQSMPASR